MKVKITASVPHAHPSVIVGAELTVTQVESDGVRVDAPWGNHVPQYAYVISDGSVNVPALPQVTAHTLSKPVVKRTKRAFSAGYKQRILAEYDSLGYGTKGKLLEREGLTGEHLSYWRKQAKQGHFSTDRIVSFHRGDSLVE